MADLKSVVPTLLEHSLPLLVQAARSLPLLLQDGPRFRAALQDSWHLQWKKYVLGFLVSPWMHAKQQALAALPSEVGALLQNVAPGTYWIFDTAMFLQSLPQPTTPGVVAAAAVRYSSEQQRHDAVIAGAAAPTGTAAAAQESPPKKRNRLVLVLDSASQIVCASVEVQQSTRTVFFEASAGFFQTRATTTLTTTTLPPLEPSPFPLQVWALDCTINRLREVHMVYGVSLSLKIANVALKGADTFLPQLHPLRPLVEFIIFQMESLYRSAAEHQMACPQKEDFAQLLQQFEKRVALDETYLDVRQRAISRTQLAGAFRPSQLYPLRTLKHSLYADPTLQACRSSEHADRAFDEMKNLSMHNCVFSMYFAGRCEIEHSLLEQFQRLNLTTQHNVQLRKWADYVQSELDLRTHLNSSSHAWPYTVICMLSDLLHLTSEHQEALSQLHPQIWNGVESDDLPAGFRRIQAWTAARQGGGERRASVGGANPMVREFIVQRLVPSANAARQRATNGSMSAFRA